MSLNSAGAREHAIKELHFPIEKSSSRLSDLQWRDSILIKNSVETVLFNISLWRRPDCNRLLNFRTLGQNDILLERECTGENIKRRRYITYITGL